jgi:hypothetical protein
MVAAAVMVVVLVVVLKTDVLAIDITWLSCCWDEPVKESLNGFRRSINCGFDPDTGKFLFFNSAFKSLTTERRKCYVKFGDQQFSSVVPLPLVTETFTMSSS